MLACADFETTTIEEDCRVWAFGICEIGNVNNFIYGNSIDDFMHICADKFENHTFYFHNLKFDGMFIMYWLFRNGYEHVVDRKEFKDKSFTTLISDKGMFYSIEICFKKKGKKINKVTFLDSLKILNFSVTQIAKDFGLPLEKLELDYETIRPVGHELTEHEIKYLRHDVEIMSRALEFVFSQGMDKMTMASDALQEYKKILGKDKFSKLFPVPDYDSDIRQSYKGGWTYLAPRFKEKEVKDGIVLDVNSLYPWVMHDCLLPYGEPLYFEGKYEKDDLYPLYVQKFTCSFKLKPRHVATIQIKTKEFNPTEYLESSTDKYGVFQEVTLCMTNIDLELFLDHYDVFNMEYISGYKFRGSTEMFKPYVDKWTEEKIKAKLEGNYAMYKLSKLMLNSLYGKFALSPIVRGKIPLYDKHKDKIKFTYGDEEERTPIYIPVGSFITSWARNKTIRTAQMCYDRFIYADTDSLHLTGTDVPRHIGVDDTKLGAWKLEFVFTRGKYLRQKCYMEYGKDPFKPDEKPYEKITCAGMPSACYPDVTFEKFHIGETFKGLKRPKNVSGGIILEKGTFKIKESAYFTF